MKPNHEEVATRAYFLWLKAGKPEGRDWDHWFIAEFEALHDWHKDRPPLKVFPHRPA